MASFQVIETFRDGPAFYLSGIADLQVVAGGGGLRLYSATRPGGGVLALDVGMTMTLNDLVSLAVVAAIPAAPRIDIATINGADMLIVTGGNAARLTGYPMEAAGGLGAAYTINGSPFGAISALEQVRAGTESYVYTARLGDNAIVISRMLANGRMEEAGQMPLGADWQGTEISDMAQATIGGQTYLLALAVQQAAVLSFRVGVTGELSLAGTIGATGGLGLAAPSVIETARVAGVDYAIVAGAGSSSISVLCLGADGTLSLADHVIDSLDTRFQGVQAMTSVVLGDRVYLFAGGGDDGITAFTLLPGGRLLPVGQEVQRAGGALENITALTGIVQDGRIEVFAAGEGMGITRLRFDPGPVAPMRLGGDAAEQITGDDRFDLIDGGAGNDTLAGGRGNDILVDGAGTDVLSGGPGADLFVLVRDGQTDHITDFEPGLDSLDLSAWGRVYALEAMQIRTTGTGATIRFGGETLILDTSGGVPLSASDFTSAELFPLTHVIGDPVAAGLRIDGTAGNDVQTGGAGDDVLVGSPGADRMDGAGGFDLADYSDARGSQRVDLLAPQLNTNLAQGDLHFNIEGIVGGSGPDNLRGTTGDNILRGGGNVDWLFGRRGDDLLDGGIGDDVLLGGPGQDTLAGGANRDRAQYSESLEGLTADLQFPHNNTGEASGDAYDSIEDVAGSSHNDRLFGDQGANRIFGRDGDDALFGRNGADYLNGGAGRDTLDGGNGNDTLRGGTHADTFVFNGGSDVVEDFRRSDADRLFLDDSVFGPGWTAAELTETYARATPGGVVFDFGYDNSITLLGVSGLDGLEGLVWII